MHRHGTQVQVRHKHLRMSVTILQRQLARQSKQVLLLVSCLERQMVPRLVRQMVPRLVRQMVHWSVH